MDSTNRINTAREMDILEYISGRNYIVAEEILPFFPNSKKENSCHYRFISKLKKKGCVENFLDRRGRKRGYRLTVKGTILLNDRSPEQLKNSFCSGFLRDEYDHAIYLREIQYTITKSPIVGNFISKMKIARSLGLGSRSKNIVPDSYFHLKISNKLERVALELELDQKNKKRYQKIFRAHLLSNKWDSVFYITKDTKLKAKLVQYLKEIRQDIIEIDKPEYLNSIYFCPLSEFREEKLNACFVGEEVSFSFRQLE